MQGSDVLTALDRLSSISSKADKSAELARLLQDPLFALVSRVTCDPFITFGVKPPQVTSYGWREISGTNDAVFELLKALQVRRLTGAVARSALIAAYAELTPASGEVLRRILARNLGCGLGAASLNNIRPGHVPTFGVMLAGKFEEGILLPHRRYVAEPKRDGMRAICLIEHGRAQFVTRNGRSLPALDSLARDVLATVETSYKRSMMPAIYGDGLAPALVLDGEITSGNLAQTISEVRQLARSSRTAAFEIFDIAPYAAFASEESIAISFADRRHALEQLFSHAAKHDRISLVEQRPVKDVADCYRLRSEWERRGFEGAMIKDLDAPYHKGRSHVWLKLKRHDTEDLTVRDVFEGTGRHAGLLGGVVCNFNGKLLRVSSGFCAAQRRQLWQQRDKLIGCVVEVGYQEATAHGALRHPRFIRLRDDKGFAEVAEPAQ